MTGRERGLSLDIMLGASQDSDRITEPEQVQKLQSRLGSYLHGVREQLKKYEKRQHKDYNLSTHGSEYKPGALVHLWEKTRRNHVCPKLVSKYKRPFMVVKKFDTVCRPCRSFPQLPAHHAGGIPGSALGTSTRSLDFSMSSRRAQHSLDEIVKDNNGNVMITDHSILVHCDRQPVGRVSDNIVSCFNIQFQQLSIQRLTWQYSQHCGWTSCPFLSRLGLSLRHPWQVSM